MKCLLHNHLWIRFIPTSPGKEIDTLRYEVHPFKSHGKLAAEPELEFTAFRSPRLHALSCPSNTNFFFPRIYSQWSLMPPTKHEAKVTILPWILPQARTVQIVFFWGQSFATCHFRLSGRLKYIIWGVIHYISPVTDESWLLPGRLVPSTWPRLRGPGSLVKHQVTLGNRRGHFAPHIGAVERKGWIIKSMPSSLPTIFAPVSMIPLFFSFCAACGLT